MRRYQSAERARKEFPDDKAMQVAALIHDFGKVLVEFGFPQWTIVGDTYLVGCAFPAHAAVYPDQHARLNPDAAVPELNSPCGIYESKCGTENWLCSYGHDEYLFQVLEGNKDVHSFPRELWNIIRFHSLCVCIHIPPLSSSSSSPLLQLSVAHWHWIGWSVHPPHETRRSHPQNPRAEVQRV
jgi:hypothetical protein